MAFLTSARVDFETPKQSSLGNDGKTKSTGIEMHLYDSESFERLSTPPGTANHIEFKDDDSVNTVQFDMGLMAPADFRPTPEDFKFCGLTIHTWPHGDDTWIFKPTVVLTYDDGTEVKLVPNEPVWLINEASGPLTGEFFNQ